VLFVGSNVLEKGEDKMAKKQGALEKEGVRLRWRDFACPRLEGNRKGGDARRESKGRGVFCSLLWEGESHQRSIQGGKGRLCQG